VHARPGAGPDSAQVKPTYVENPRPADTAGRPPRKYYRLTGEGALAARPRLARSAPVARGALRPARRGTRGTS